jgi:transcriptional regulator with XRE-family HTH domain
MLRRRRRNRPTRPRNPELPFAKALSAFSARHRLSQAHIAREIGLTQRAVNRWVLGRAAPGAETMARLLTFAARFDVADAHALAVAGHAEPMVQALVAANQKPPPVPPAPQLSARSLANAVACEAADALGVPTRDVRPALLAAFVEARRIGATFDALIAGFEEARAASAH